MRGNDNGHIRTLGFMAAAMAMLGGSNLLANIPGSRLAELGELRQRGGKSRVRSHIRRSCLNRFGSSAQGAEHGGARPMVVLDARGYQVGTLINGKVRNWKAGPLVKHEFTCSNPSSIDDIVMERCRNCGATQEMMEDDGGHAGPYCPRGTIPHRDLRRRA